MDDAIVVGGGIVGASTAYHLARLGARVTLVDQARAGQATAAGAGIISPGTGFSQPAALFPLAFRAVAYYQELLAHLAEDGESKTGYETAGLLQIATTEQEAARLPILLRLLQERQAAGVQNLGEVQLLDGQQTRELFPALGAVHAAIHVPDAARLDGRLMRDALRGAAQLRGARIVVSERRATLVCEGTRIGRVDVDGQALTARRVILATGAWSGQDAQALNIELPVYPQRGQILHLQGPQEAGQWPIVMGFSLYYLLTFPGGRIVAGATREQQAGFAVDATAAGVGEVINEALRMAPDLASATLQEVRVGLRPATPDGLPILGRVAQIDNLFVATGHGASGLQIGPYSGALVASLVADHRPELDLSPFSPERFCPA
jgi:D-amino-acid dehydrogenase